MALYKYAYHYHYYYYDYDYYYYFDWRRLLKLLSAVAELKNM